MISKSTRLPCATFGLVLAFILTLTPAFADDNTEAGKKLGKLDAGAATSYEKLTPAITKPANPAKPRKLYPQAEIAYKEGLKFLKAEDYYGAINKFERAASFDKKVAKVQRALAMTFHKMGNMGKAYEHITKALEQAGDDLEGQVLRGKIAMSQGKTDEAINAFRTALLCTGAKPEEPQAAYALLSLTILLDLTGHLQASLDLSEKLSGWISEHSDNYVDVKQLKDVILKPQTLYLRRGDLLLRLNLPAKAIKMLNLAYQRDKTGKRAAKTLLKAMSGAKQFDRAEKLLAEMAAEPILQDVVLDQAESLCLADNDASRPLRIWNLFGDKGRGTSALAISLAKAARRVKSNDDAITILESALKSEPDNANLGSELAGVYVKAGLFEKALIYFASVIHGNPAANISIHQGIKELAGAKSAGNLLDTFVNKTDKSPPNKRYAMYYVAGVYARMLGKTDRAITLYASSVKASPNFLPACEELVETCALVKRYDQADKHLQTMDTKGPSAYFTFYLRGKLELARKQSTKAVELFAQSLQLNPKHAPARLNLALSFERNGNNGEASRAFLQAMSLRQDDPDY
ncbi:MAG TPA: tetratricopeptide repeat protein, partial [Phycisphaerae bacterium]|nr:tetratricopeptide repeat protein [Phycisphaerae bacterium]